MSPDLWPVLTAVPSTACWDFGGYLYALEPLTLPAPGRWPAAAADDHEARGTRGGEVLRPMSLVAEYGLPAELRTAGGPTDELFWFRWITGHQVSFILWRLIGLTAGDAGAGRRGAGEVPSALSHYVRGYCAMLLYTASCPPRVYERVIRPSMRLRHPAFSGSWAADYWTIRDLMRGRRMPPPDLPGAADLAAALRLQHAVHKVVAARLVPDGESLLRQSRVRSWDVGVLNLLYDSFFLTARAAVVEGDVVAQLLRRLVAVARDVAVNGLYPDDDDLGDRGRDPWDADVVACGLAVPQILDDVATSAVRVAGLVLDGRSRPGA